MRSRVTLGLVLLLSAGCNDSALAPSKGDDATPTPTVPEGQAAPVAVIAGGSFFSPGETTTFDGSGSYDPDGTIAAFGWTLASKPAGSAASIPASGVSVGITFDVAGDYTIRLSVTDDDGLTADAEVSVGVAAPTGLRVELAWPAQYGQADLDVHLLAPGGAFKHVSLDCFWYNCAAGSPGARPDWGVTGNAGDDPGLNGDNILQSFPENVSIADPADGTYRVEVHHYPLAGPPVTATGSVTVYAGTTVVWSGTKSLEKKDLWDAVDVTWSGSTATVQVVDIVTPNQQ